ncbi:MULTISPECIES: hypothetical protein [Clostridium]|uniref:hypothetical protein n=1 Tax=Clostridium TaxID=1485 RepID=UPI000823FFF0|nr:MULTISPECIES: hypothetical protein [Clostridium]PJI08704.1 hypothetical protein CUB90_12885 [Clostridium sp. CT7]
MNYTFFALIVLCVTALSIVAMLLAFCYRQEKSIAFRNKIKADRRGISSQLMIDIDSSKKTNKKENSK